MDTWCWGLRNKPGWARPLERSTKRGTIMSSKGTQHFAPSLAPIAAAIAVVIRSGKVLLVRRANPPDAGLWAFPGGRIEGGETIHAAALRELREETGVTARAVQVLTALDAFDRAASGELRWHFILVAVICAWEAGEPVAADDATEGAWFDMDELADGKLALSLDVADVARRAAAAQIQQA